MISKVVEKIEIKSMIFTKIFRNSMPIETSAVPHLQEKIANDQFLLPLSLGKFWSH